MATYKHIRSSTANKRPTTSIADGQLAINTNTTSPGLFFKDSAGTGIVKVGPVHVGTTAPNASPAVGGSSGNYLGEQWLDTSVSPAQMKVWNGSAWVGIVADELPVSKLQDGAARQLIQTDAAGTGVEWTSNIDVPGTLDVTSTATFDSIAQHPLGTAGAPTITFTGDNNTGIYSPGADQLALSTNGTGRLFVASNGSVGVGAPVPGTKLEVAGSAAFRTDADVRLTLGSAGSIGANDSNFIRAATDTLIYNAAAGRHSWEVAGSEKMRITSAGLVGVGTSTPSSILHCSSTDAVLTLQGTRGTGATASIGTGGTNSQNLVITAGTDLYQRGATHLFQNVAGTTEYARITSAGLVGIGAASPSNKLDVNGDAALLANGQLKFADATNQQVAIINNGGAANTSQLRFLTGSSPTERARIDSSGRLLVGTSTSPSAGQGANSRLVVQGYVGDATDIGIMSIQRGEAATSITSGEAIGRIAFNDNAGNSFAYVEAYADANAGSGDYPGRLVFSVTRDGQSSPTEALRIANSGQTTVYAGSSQSVLRVKTQSGAGTALGLFVGSYDATGVADGTGSIVIWSNGNVVNTNNSYGSLSDLKLKENIVDAASQWSDIKALRVRKYNFKEGQTHTQIGLVAQEVELVSPGLVSESPDRDAEGNDLGTVTKSVNYSVLYMKAVKALQEAMERIETLEAKVAALESA